MSTRPSALPEFRERLWPAPTLFIALLLILPSVTLAVFPVSADLAIPVAIAVYVIVNLTLLLAAPKIVVSGGWLHAGNAKIHASYLRDPETLDAAQLREAIGPKLDARSYLMIRGYIHRGVKVENIDANDPAPYWIITSRKPQELASAIRQSESAPLEES